MPKSGIVVIGDVMVDYLVHGCVAKLAPEAPVPVFVPTRTDVLPGGAANVAANLAAMGVKTLLLGAVGRDAASRDLEHACNAIDGLHARLIASSDSATVTRTRYVAGSSHLLRVDGVGELRANGAELLHALTQSLESGEVRAVVVADYDKGTMREIGFQLTGLCAKYQIPLVVDAKPAVLSQYTGASVIKVNLAEATEYLAGACGHLAMLYQDPVSQSDVLAKQLQEHLRASVVVVTAGAAGVSAVVGSMSMFQTGLPVTAIDTTGAGDTFLAGLARQMGVTVSLADAIRWANVAASIAVGRVGTSIVSLADVAEQLVAKPPVTITHDEVIALVKKWKNEGDTVVFTNGCFDLFHGGHVSLLRSAAAMGRRLVVAVDRDSSVRALKGLDRPQQPEHERVASVSYYADAVVLFSSDELQSLVSHMLPTVLVKGAEYEDKRIVGADAVLAEGGRVCYVPMVSGISTTAIIAETS